MLSQAFLEALNLLISGNEEVYSAIRATLTVSTVSLLFCLITGIPCGFFLGYCEVKGKRTLQTIVNTSLALPTVFIGLMVYTMLSRKGPLGNLDLLFSLPAIAIGQFFLGLPIIIALTASQVEAIDKRLYSTLKGLGASGRQILIATIWEARFALLTAAVTAYGRIMTEVGISMMVGGNIKYHTRTITTAITLETGKGEFVTGIALGLILLLIALTVNLVLTFLKRKTLSCSTN